MKFLAIRNININFPEKLLLCDFISLNRKLLPIFIIRFIDYSNTFFLSNQSSWRSPLNEIKLRKTLTPYLDVSSAEVVY